MMLSLTVCRDGASSCSSYSTRCFRLEKRPLANHFWECKVIGSANARARSKETINCTTGSWYVAILPESFTVFFVSFSVSLIEDSNPLIHADHPWLQNTKKAPDIPLGDVVRSRLKQFSAMNKLKKKALRVRISISDVKAPFGGAFLEIRVVPTQPTPHNVFANICSSSPLVLLRLI